MIFGNRVFAYVINFRDLKIRSLWILVGPKLMMGALKTGGKDRDTHRGEDEVERGRG